MQIFQHKKSYIVALVAGIIIFIAIIFLMGELERVRVKGIVAILLGMGGPQLLATLMAVVGGGFIGLCYDTRNTNLK